MLKGFYFITDSKLSKHGNVSDVLSACEAGSVLIQYREKSLSTRDMMNEAIKLRSICSRACFIVNDRVDIALACDADGVHLGQDDMDIKTARKILPKNKMIGITVHNIGEAEYAHSAGADYLAVSPVYNTITKNNAGRPCGLALINDIRKMTHLPIVAIGGITLENASGVRRAGADMLCAISSVLGSEDVKSEILKFQSFFN
jgi:thiamine-phosphate pyrophosphorylase